MEDAISTSILKGRSYGGVGVIMKSKFSANLIYQKVYKRCVILVFHNIIIISLYLPSIKYDSDTVKVEDILTEIELVIDKYPNHSVICGGDYNANLKERNRATSLIDNFRLKYALSVQDNSNSTNVNALKYTYSHETLGYFSYIDYFLVSNNLNNVISKCEILDFDINFSDHNPIPLMLKIDVDKGRGKALIQAKDDQIHTAVKKQIVLRWDHSNLSNYYGMTYELFVDIN